MEVAGVVEVKDMMVDLECRMGTGTAKDEITLETMVIHLDRLPILRRGSWRVMGYIALHRKRDTGINRRLFRQADMGDMDMEEEIHMPLVLTAVADMAVSLHLQYMVNCSSFCVPITAHTK